MLTVAQHDIAKKDQFCLKRYNFSEKLDAQNKSLRTTIGSMIEELGMARESLQASEERVADLEKMAAALREDLSLARERSSEVDELREERVKLIARCGELKEEVRQEAAWVREVPSEVVKKIKKDYLTSEEFQEEKFECTMDGHSRGFNECLRQIRELDPSFDMTRLRKDLSKEEEDEERANVDK